MRTKVPFIQQMEHSECALANVAMILNYYGHHITLNELREFYPSSKAGYSFKNMYDIFSKFGINSKVYHVEKDSIMLLKFPLICLWENDHFVILESVKRNSYYIIDPAKGRFRVSKKEFQTKFQHFVMCSEKTEKFVYRTKSKESVLQKYLKANAFGLVTLLILTLIMQLFIALVPILNKNIVDFLTEKSTINAQIFIYLSIFLFGGIILISLTHSIYLSILQYTIDKTISKDFINHLISLPFSFFDNRSTGDLLFRTNSIIHIREILSKNFITMIVDLFTIATFSIILLMFSPIIAIFLFSISFLLTAIIYWSSKHLRNLVDNNIRQQISVEGASNEIVRQNLDIKLLGIERTWSEKWNELNTKQLETNKKLNIFSGILESFNSSIRLIIPIFVLLMGFKLYLNNAITIGELVASSTISATFVNPIVSISNNYTNFLMLRGYIDRIEDVFLTKKESDKLCGQKACIDFNNDITINNLYFRYTPFDDFILKDINMVIPKNKTIAIVGKSGSGKSTLAKIILGLLSPYSGNVKIDNQNIKLFSINDYRKIFGSVLQNSSLFRDSIKENLTLGEDISEKRLKEVAKITEIDNIIFNQPLGLNTIISENGNNFSGGQKQRFLLARALLNSPQILVFDEATSNLDYQTESNITRYINSLNITKIIIAHRLSTIANADIIYVVDEGEIKEVGTHADLIKMQGIYSTLYGKENII